MVLKKPGDDTLRPSGEVAASALLQVNPGGWRLLHVLHVVVSVLLDTTYRWIDGNLVLLANPDTRPIKSLG